MADRRGGNGPFDPPRVPQMPQIHLPDVPPGALRVLLLLVAGIILFWGSFYQVGPEEVGVIRRFGAYARTTDPG